MSYFNYHGTIKKLIADGKLIGYKFVGEYHGISPALLLFFDDAKHPIIPVREHRFQEYLRIIEKQNPTA